jgi:CBS domain-containing protein
MTEKEFTPPSDRVGDNATRCVLTVGKSDTLWKARGLMTDGRVSRLAATNTSALPLGAVSKHDLARFLLDDSTSRGLEEISVGEACSRPVQLISSEMSVSEAARIFNTKNLACAVVSENDRPIM